MRTLVFFLLALACAGGCGPLSSTSSVYEPPVVIERQPGDLKLAPKYPQPELSLAPDAEAAAPPLASPPGAEFVLPETKAVPPGQPSVKLVSGNPKIKKIALTFDDGPHRGFTERLLALLKELNVKATFFMIGRNVDEAPDLARAAQNAGIEIGNHTYTHSRLATLNDESIRDEITKGAKAIELATGQPPVFFRPPGGEYDDRVINIVRELGMTMVLWTSDAGDYTTIFGNPSMESIKKKVLSQVKPGAIIIMHDPMPGSLQALPSIVTTLRALGYEFVTVSELAADPGAVRTGGPKIKPNKLASVQALVNEARYPMPKSKEDKNANSEQGTAGTATPKGKEDQGTDPRSQGWGKGKQIGEVDKP